MRHKGLSNEAKATLRTMWDAGVSRAEIASTLHTTPYAVAAIRQREKLVAREHTGKRQPQAIVDQIISLRKEGLSWKVIGDRLGLSKGSVGGIIRRWEKRRDVKLPSAVRYWEPRVAEPVLPVVPVQREAVVAPAMLREATPIRRPSVCQWPIGGDEGPRSIRFECDAKPLPERPYCRLHCRAAYVGFHG